MVYRGTAALRFTVPAPEAEEGEQAKHESSPVQAQKIVGKLTISDSGWRALREHLLPAFGVFRRGHGWMIAEISPTWSSLSPKDRVQRPTIVEWLRFFALLSPAAKALRGGRMMWAKQLRLKLKRDPAPTLKRRVPAFVELAGYESACDAVFEIINATIVVEHPFQRDTAEALLVGPEELQIVLGLMRARVPNERKGVR